MVESVSINLNLINLWFCIFKTLVGTITKCRVTTCLENLEMSGNLTAVREMSGTLLKLREVSGKNLVREKLSKTVYC